MLSQIKEVFSSSKTEAWGKEYQQCCREITRSHHERYDGKGYPYGLKGKNICKMARVLAVADTYDAMTSDRPYRKGMSDEKAVEEIIANKGTQFEPEVVDTFVEYIQEKMKVGETNE